MSINDIRPFSSRLRNGIFKDSPTLRWRIFTNEVFSLEREEVEVLKKDLVEKFTKAGQTFKETEGRRVGSSCSCSLCLHAQF